MSDIWRHAQRPFSELLDEVAAAQVAESVSTEGTELRYGAAHMNIRRQGGFLTKLALRSDAQGVVDVLYADPDLSKSKLPASHVMFPVGANTGPGGQHGPVRWVEHGVVNEIAGGNGLTAVSFVPRMALGMPFVSRQVGLKGESQARLGIGITNTLPVRLAGSLGEHLYFAMPEGGAADIRIDGEGIDTLIGQGASEAIDSGKAQFWDGYQGRSEVALPHGTRLTIGSEIKVQGTVSARIGGSLGMLMWRRPGEPYVCLEPTLGYGIDGSNDNLVFDPMSTASFVTTIKLQ